MQQSGVRRVERKAGGQRRGRGRGREKWETASVLWKESWISRSPLPRYPIAVMVSSVPSGPPVQKVWDCANHDKQSLSLRGRCSTDSRVTRHRQITIHGCSGVEEGPSWRGEGGQGGFRDPSSGGPGVPTSPPTMVRRRWTPAPPCAHLSFPIRTSLPSLFRTRTPQHRDDMTVPIAASEPRCWPAFPVSF